MFEKNMRIAYLLDFYADLLDEHIGEIMRAYYEDDLSLSEIASGAGISRQGVRHLIKKGEDLLEFYDSKLGLAARHAELITVCDSLSEISERLADNDAYSGDAEEIKRLCKVIMKGNQDVPKSNR